MATEDGNLRPRFKRLTACGGKAWVAFTAAHAAELNREDFPDHLRGCWSKLRGYGGRLALIVHCLRMACGEAAGPDVDGESVRRAASLVRYFKAHARRLYGLMMADREGQAAHKLLKWIARKNLTEFKRWEAHRDLESREWFPNMKDLDPPLERLVRHHYLRVRQSPKNPKGGRPADPVYEVNPSWDRRVNRENRGNPSADVSEGGLLGSLGDAGEGEDDLGNPPFDEEQPA
jgi:hypothetical protein